MASEHDPVNWIIPFGPDAPPYITIVFLESNVNSDSYLAIYRITNTSEVDVIVRTAEGSTLTLLGQQADGQPASIDVSSTMIFIQPAGRSFLRRPLTGTYQLLCCSVGQISSFTERLQSHSKIKAAKRGAKRKAINK
jgi:hypothetical protein